MVCSIFANDGRRRILADSFDGCLGEPIGVRELPVQVRSFCVGATGD